VSLTGKRILVTGATGRTGQHVVDSLLASGHSRVPVIGESTDDIIGILSLDSTTPGKFFDN
jgi:CBS domain containing-hemolysin-like protein